jgi:hypothetical protein
MRRWPLILISLLVVVAPSLGDPKKPEPKDLPRVVLSVPLGIAPGKEAKLVVRGLKLDEVTEVRFHEPKATVKILNKAKSAPPNKEDPARLGDSQMEIQATIPADYTGATVEFTVVTPAGESPPHKLLVDHEPVIPEKEPNNGFRQAQPVQLGQTVEGVVSQGLDVDTFRFEGKAGQQVVLEVFAARYGSPLDSLLTLFDADGRILATNDDLDSTTADSRIEATLPKAGVFYVSLQDANDQDGPHYAYRLSLRAK